MTSNIFFKMVISQLDSDLTSRVKNECWMICCCKVFHCSCCVYYLLIPLLKPFRYSVSNFKIEKFSLLISRWVRVSLNLEVFVNWSTKLWLSCWKCFQVITASTLFSLILKLVSAFPTHCLLYKMLFIIYIYIYIYIYNVAARTVDLVEYLIYLFGLLTFKSSCFSYLLATKWP